MLETVAFARCVRTRALARRFGEVRSHSPRTEQPADESPTVTVSPGPDQCEAASVPVCACEMHVAVSAHRSLFILGDLGVSFFFGSFWVGSLTFAVLLHSCTQPMHSCTVLHFSVIFPPSRLVASRAPEWYLL